MHASLNSPIILYIEKDKLLFKELVFTCTRKHTPNQSEHQLELIDTCKNKFYGQHLSRAFRSHLHPNHHPAPGFKQYSLLSHHWYVNAICRAPQVFRCRIRFAMYTAHILYIAQLYMSMHNGYAVFKLHTSLMYLRKSHERSDVKLN